MSKANDCMFYIDPLDYEYEEALLVMNELKKYYLDYNNEEDQRDQCRVLFNEFCVFFQRNLMEDIENKIKINRNIFCVMAPVGGPLYIEKDDKSVFLKKGFSPSVFEITHQGYIGFIYLIKNLCGVDNFEILAS